MKIAAFVLLLGFCSSAYAGTVLFSDDFNRDTINPTSGAPLWVGKSGTTSDLHGTIVDNALTFTQTNSAGDTFTSSAVIPVLAGQFYELKFDYLGTSAASGGFIGLSTGTPGNHNWLAGTTQSAIAASGLPLTILPSSTASRVLASDNEWHTYSILFRSATNQSLRVMMEDFTAPAGNAFFDNIQVAAVPVPAAAWIGGALMGALGFVRVLRRR